MIRPQCLRSPLGPGMDAALQVVQRMRALAEELQVSEIQTLMGPELTGAPAGGGAGSAARAVWWRAQLEGCAAAPLLVLPLLRSRGAVAALMPRAEALLYLGLQGPSSDLLHARLPVQGATQRLCGRPSKRWRRLLGSL